MVLQIREAIHGIQPIPNLDIMTYAKISKMMMWPTCKVKNVLLDLNKPCNKIDEIKKCKLPEHFYTTVNEVKQ